MSKEWPKEQISLLKVKTEALKALWEEMGELSKLKPSDITLDDLKERAGKVCKKIFEATVDPEFITNALLNYSGLDEADKKKAKKILEEIKTIVSETKELSDKSDLGSFIIDNALFQLGISESAGELTGLGKTLYNVGTGLLKSTASEYIEKSLNKLGTSSEEVMKIANTMKTIIEGDPEGVIVGKLKEKLNDKFAEAIGPTNSVVGEIAKSCACGAFEKALEGDFNVLENAVDSGISKLKEFKGKGTTLDDTIIDVIDKTYETVKNGGTLHAVANNIYEAGKNYVVTEGKALLKEKLNEMCGSSESMKEVADAIMRMTEEDPRTVVMDVFKKKLTEKFAESAKESNSIAMRVAHVAIVSGAEAGVNAGINAVIGIIKENSDKAVGEIKAISQKAEVPQTAVDAFDMQQDVSKGAGELLAHADIIEEKINEIKGKTSNPTVLENINEMTAAYNELKTQANNMIASTLEDPCQISLEQIKSKVKEASAAAAGPIERIAVAAGKAIATGLIDSAVSTLFEKIKEKASDAKQSQEKVAAKADSAGSSGSSNADSAAGKDSATDSAAADSKSNAGDNAADQKDSQQDDSQTADNANKEGAEGAGDEQQGQEDKSEDEATADASSGADESDNQSETAGQGDDTASADSEAAQDTQGSEDQAGQTETADNASGSASEDQTAQAETDSQEQEAGATAGETAGGSAATAGQQAGDAAESGQQAGGAAESAADAASATDGMQEKTKAATGESPLDESLGKESMSDDKFAGLSGIDKDSAISDSGAQGESGAGIDGLKDSLGEKGSLGENAATDGKSSITDGMKDSDSLFGSDNKSLDTENPFGKTADAGSNIGENSKDDLFNKSFEKDGLAQNSSADDLLSGNKTDADSLFNKDSLSKDGLSKDGLSKDSLKGSDKIGEDSSFFDQNPLDGNKQTSSIPDNTDFLSDADKIGDSDKGGDFLSGIKNKFD